MNTPNLEPFTIVGTDMTDPANWPVFADMYLAYYGLGSQNDVYPVDEIEEKLLDFPQTDPENAMRCLEHLSDHPLAPVRQLAGKTALIDLVSYPNSSMEPGRSVAVIAKVLRQTDEWPTVVTDSVWEEFIKPGAPSIGAKLVTEVVNAYNETRARLRPAEID